jgi:regulator of protease activity HflC (stomatin/prohibitin superfamily)
VSQLRSNIVPPPTLQAAIIAKTQSIQQAQASLQQVTVAEANGKIAKAKAQADSTQAVITAAGHANATLIEARADAEAIKLKQQQVTTTYVDFVRASNWDGKLPTTMLGGSNTLFSLTK